MVPRTEHQRVALERFLSELAAVRGFKDVHYKLVNTPTWLLVKLDIPDFPVIAIGGRGGFEMPEIRTYPTQAFTSCLWGDEHVRRQGSGAAKDSPLISGLV